MNEDIHKKPVETQKDSSESPIAAAITADESPPLMEAVSDTTPTFPEGIAHGRPWGFWVSIAFGMTILLISFMIELIAGVAAVVMLTIVNEPSPDSQSEFASSGFVLSIATLIAAPVSCGLSLFFASLRRNITIREYMGLQWPPAKLFFRWVLNLIVVIILCDGINMLSGGQIVHDSMIEIHHSAGFLPLLYFVIIVAAPLSEEFLFRGFLLEGLRYSWLRKWGAIIVTAIAWSSLHIQYGYRELLMILALGMLLGYARIRTGSLWLCVLLHAITNSIACIQLLIYLRWLQS